MPAKKRKAPTTIVADENHGEANPKRDRRKVDYPEPSKLDSGLAHKAAATPLKLTGPLLWASTSPLAWGNVFSQELSSKFDGTFKALNSWYLFDLPVEIRSRKPPSIIREELSKIMQWKLKRGKWRPRLQKLVDSIADRVVVGRSMRAFELLDQGNIQKAIEELTAKEMSGVGPATATAILSAYSDTMPFMSDQALTTVLGDRAYTTAKAVQLQKSLSMKAEILNGGETGSMIWTAKTVEQALWLSAVDE